MNTNGLAQKILQGNKRAAAKMLSLLESHDPKAQTEIKKLYPHTGKALILGITGSQGSGKSSVIGQLMEQALSLRKKIGVLAVDPSSHVSGGAFLGDRIRIQRHSLHPNVFIRSMAARGHRGGLSPSIRDAIRVIDAMGSDLIFVESIGVGQDEVEIATVTDITLLVLTPHSGDKIQMLKAGLFEACDLLILNKSDLPGSKTTFATLTQMLPIPLLSVSALKGTGFKACYDWIESKWAEAQNTERAQERRLENLQTEIFHKVEEGLLNRFEQLWRKNKGMLQKGLRNKQHPDQLVKQLLKKVSK